MSVGSADEKRRRVRQVAPADSVRQEVFTPLARDSPLLCGSDTAPSTKDLLSKVLQVASGADIIVGVCRGSDVYPVSADLVLQMDALKMHARAARFACLSVGQRSGGGSLPSFNVGGVWPPPGRPAFTRASEKGYVCMRWEGAVDDCLLNSQLPTFSKVVNAVAGALTSPPPATPLSCPTGWTELVLGVAAACLLASDTAAVPGGPRPRWLLNVAVMPTPEGTVSSLLVDPQHPFLCGFLTGRGRVHGPYLSYELGKGREAEIRARLGVSRVLTDDAHFLALFRRLKAEWGAASGRFPFVSFCRVMNDASAEGA